jgi:membrane protein
MARSMPGTAPQRRATEAARAGPASRHVPLRRLVPQVAKNAVAEFSDDHCAQYASSIAYHVLFSIFPLAIVLAAVFGLVVQATGTRADVVDSIAGYVPLSSSGDQTFRNLLEGATGGLSALGLLGLVGVFYAASGMMGSIRLALNQAWDVDDYRPFLKGKLVDVSLVLAAAGLGLLSVGLTVAVRVVGDAAGSVPGGSWVRFVLAVLVPFVTSTAVVLFLYRVVPAASVRLADALPGAVSTSVVFVLLENLFALYVQHFTNYNAVYGSLGAIIAFMFFVYLCSLAFLLGAEVASEWPRVRAQLARGEAGGGETSGAEAPDGAPLVEKARRALKGLWVDERGRDGGRERRARRDR